MDKTEMMLKFEAETGEKAKKKVLVMYSTKRYGWGRERNSFFFTNKFVEWLLSQLDKYQAKAAAYDRLMSGGKKTLKEWANIFGMPFAIDGGRYGYNCDDVGSKEPLIWIPPRFIDYDGNYGESRTLPDGWEE